jgi:hypothetical protein
MVEIVTNESAFALVSARDREAVKRGLAAAGTAKQDLAESEHGGPDSRHSSDRSGSYEAAP